MKSYFTPEQYDDEKYLKDKFGDIFEEKEKYVPQSEKNRIELMHRNVESFRKSVMESLDSYRRKNIIIKKKIDKKKFWRATVRTCMPPERKYEMAA